jgi:arylsulfatase A-like enzyme
VNFIIIVSDTFRFDNLACYTQSAGKGARAARPRFDTPKGDVMTPHLDRFAQQSTVFENAYIGSFPTVPNRKDLLTGRLVFPWEAWSPLRPDAVTLPRLLRKAGYETMMVLDTPHIIRQGFNFDRDFNGFDFVRGQETDQLASWLADQPFDPSLVRGAGNWKQHLANIAEIRRSEKDCFVAQTMTRATQWLERWYDRNNGQRNKFMLYVDTFDPHEPWDAPTWYEDLYDPGYKGPVNRYVFQGPVEGRFSKAEVDHFRAIYAAEVTLVDRWIGFFMETIERMGLMDDTCIIFTADHGTCIGEHGMNGKGGGFASYFYEEVAHIPLVVRLPGQTKARRLAPLAQSCDVMPTILDLAGVKKPDTLHGHSLKPMLKGGSRPVRRFAFARHGSEKGDLLQHSAVFGEGWALLLPDMKPGEDPSTYAPSLFNLKTDPLQKKNVIKQNREVAREMWDAFDQWLREVDAPGTMPLQPRP